MPTTFRDIDGLETVNSKLEFSSKPSYYKDGKMTLKCVANQFGIYKQRTEQKLEDDSPQLAHVLSPSTTLSHSKLLFILNFCQASLKGLFDEICKFKINSSRVFIRYVHHKKTNERYKFS